MVNTSRKKKRNKKYDSDDKVDTSLKKKRNKKCDDRQSEKAEADLEEKEKFRGKKFLVIIDCLTAELKSRIAAYDAI